MNSLKYLLTFCLLTLVPMKILGQDYTWWNIEHDWELGDPHWSHYIRTNPANMGPNALPVPAVYKARLDSMIQYELRFDQFSHPEDQTSDLAAIVYIPIAEGKAAIKITALREWYHMSEKIRDERRARDFDPKGSISGDVNFEFKYQILRNQKGKPDLSFHAGLKTASGGDFRNARFTDSPAYNFALSVGNTHNNKNHFIQQIEWNLMLGLYVWQTYVDDSRQNDAPLYGFSLVTRHNNWSWDNSLSGYSGYQGEGEYPEIYGDIPKSDHPLIYKTEISYLNNKWLYKAAFKKGFYSFKYDVYQVSLGYRIKPKA